MNLNSLERNIFQMSRLQYFFPLLMLPHFVMGNLNPTVEMHVKMKGRGGERRKEKTFSILECYMILLTWKKRMIFILLARIWNITAFYVNDFHCYVFQQKVFSIWGNFFLIGKNTLVFLKQKWGKSTQDQGNECSSCINFQVLQQ